MDFREDTLVMPVLAKLATCLCEQIEESGLPPTCFCGVLPTGDEVTLDFCSPCATGACGQAWARLVPGTLYPSTQFPLQDDGSVTGGASCDSPIVFTLEAGIARCAPTFDDHGNPPNVPEQYDATAQQMAEMSAIRRAIACCMKARTYQLGSYVGFTSGDCLGGAWTVTVGEV